MITKDYTPARWSLNIDEDNPENNCALDSNGDMLYWIPGYHYSVTQETKMANERIKVAAPELVEASEKSLDVLRDYLERMTDGDCDPELVAEIKGAIESTRAALTKAGVLTENVKP